MINNIFIGVVAGILTYVFIALIARFLNKIAIPWYQGIIYKGNNIAGEWYGYDAKVENGIYSEGEESRSTILLKQQGNKVTGELLLTQQPNGERCRKLFELSGSFVDTILVVNRRAKDSQDMGTGTIVLKLTESGKKLKGKETFISAHDWSTVFSIDQVWVRKT